MEVSLLDSSALCAPVQDNRLADRSIKNLITRLVIGRAAEMRGTNPGLADQFLKLAIIGHVNPSVYAAVLARAEPVKVTKFAGEIGSWFQSA